MITDLPRRLRELSLDSGTGALPPYSFQLIAAAADAIDALSLSQERCPQCDEPLTKDADGVLCLTCRQRAVDDEDRIDRLTIERDTLQLTLREIRAQQKDDYARADAAEASQRP